MALIDRDNLMALARNHVNGMVDCNDIARVSVIDPVHAANGVYCRECGKLFIENMTRNTAEPFSEMAFQKARASGEYVILHCRLYGVTRGTLDFCSYGRRREGGER